jgi:hypothetical protein
MSSTHTRTRGGTGSRCRASWQRVVRRVVVTGALAAGLLTLEPAQAEAADECRGLQTCLPVAGPWVEIPAPAKGQAASTAVWELRCPLRGYIVAGIDARVSDRGVDVSFRGESGSPVSAGVTTGASVLFAGTSTGPARRAVSFRPFIGCVPVSGGGGRAATAHVRTPAAFPPDKPIERRVTTVRVRPGQSRSVRATCKPGERLVASDRSIAVARAREPEARILAGVKVTGSNRGRTALAQARASSSLPRGLRVLAQVHAVCARAPS